MAQQSRSSSTGNRNLGLAAGAALLAVGATALYFFTGKRGERNRRKVGNWILQAKGEILERMEAVKDLNEDTYGRIVDSVLARYRTVRDVSSSELGELARELKAHWRDIERKVSRTKPASVRKRRSRPAKTGDPG